MSELAPPRSEHKPITVALIGAGATILVALIGLVPTLLRGKSGAAPSGAAEPAPVRAVQAEAPAAARKLFSFRKAKPAKAEPPPLRLSHRKAMVPGQGMVLGLTNATDKETLKNVVVLVTSASAKDERRYRVARSIRPSDSIAVGWRELRGWKLRPGDRVKIKVDGYAVPVEAIIPRR